MAPRAHFSHQLSSSNVDLHDPVIKNFYSSRIASRFENRQVTFERSAAAEFASSSWEKIINRAHYRMNEDGTPVLFEAQPSNPVRLNNDVKVPKQSLLRLRFGKVQHARGTKDARISFQHLKLNSKLLKKASSVLNVGKDRAHRPIDDVSMDIDDSEADEMDNICSGFNKLSIQDEIDFYEPTAVLNRVHRPIDGCKADDMDNICSVFNILSIQDEIDIYEPSVVLNLGKHHATQFNRVHQWDIDDSDADDIDTLCSFFKKLSIDNVLSEINIDEQSTVLGSYADFSYKYFLTNEQLGENGAFGAVFKAIRKSDGMPVAIKTIKKSNIPEFGWGFINGNKIPLEYCILKQVLGCQGVNKLLDGYFFDNEQLYIYVLELINNCCTLENFITEQGPMEETLIKSILIKLLEAVDDCHKAGACHRDIKESNIVINKKTMIPEIIDFGAADTIKNSPFTCLVGTHCFMAPEIKEGYRPNGKGAIRRFTG